MATRIHPTAIVHANAVIGEGCEIGPFCIVGKDAKLGARNRLIAHVVIENDVTLGEDNIAHPFAVLGGAPQDLKYHGERTRLEIGNKNTIRESVTLNLGTEGGGGLTKIGDQNLLMAYVHLGHDTIVGNNTVIANGCQIAGHVTIEDWAILGGLSGVSQFVRVGAHCYVGGCSGVDRDVPPFIVARGPAGAVEVLGMNLVGLKRRGFESSEISTLQEINKMFFKDKSLEKEAALQKLETTLGSSAVAKQFITFVRSSEKGVCR